MPGPQTINLVEINIPRHFLKYKREKSFVSSPRIMNIEKIIVLAISRNIFNEIQVALKPLEHDPECRILLFELSFGLFYKSW